MSTLPYNAESPSLSNGKGFGDLFSILIADFSRLIDQHIALLKVEARAEGERAMGIAIYGGLMLILSQFVILFAGLALLFGLVQAHYSWLAAASITFGVFGMLTLACGVFCWEKMKSALAIWKAATQ